MLDYLRQSLMIALLGVFIFAIGKSIYEAHAIQTDCVFCCNVGCDGANQQSSPTPTPTPAPTPTPTPTPPPGTATIDMVCATYGIANRDVASGADQTTADTIRDNCKLVLTWWRQTTAQNWCPFILDGNQLTAEYCGPYQNFGFMDGGSSSDTSNLGAMLYYFGGFFSTCNASSCGLVLRDDSSATPVFNNWANTNEKMMDKGSYGDSGKYIDKWWAAFIDVPDSPSQLAAWTSTAATNLWNMTFVDNFQIWTIPDGGINPTPIDPRRGGNYTQANMETDAIAGAQHLRDLADAAGKKLYCNMDGDADYHYFERGTTYRTWVSKCHYVGLEQLVRDFGGNLVSETHWLRRVRIIQDIGKNTTTIPVADGTNLGGQTYLWYNLSSILLAKEAGKGMIYFQSNIPSATNLTKMKNLDCGTPQGDFFEVNSQYYRRNWSGCIILVNPKTVATSSISLGGTYQNLETEQNITSIILQPKTGVVLVAQ